MYRAGRLKEPRILPARIAIAMLAVCKIAAAGSSGATLSFSYPNGFAGASSAIQTAGSAAFVGSAVSLTPSTSHSAGGAWYKTQQNITSFATDFTFRFASGLSVPSTAGITFSVQNTTAQTNPAFGEYGIYAVADANMDGYGAYWNSSGNAPGLLNSIAIKFDLGNSSGNLTSFPSGGAPNSTGLYVNGGPSAAMIPLNDLNPFGINFYSGHVMAAHVVYDGSLLTLTLRDTATNAQVRMSWPVNIPAIVGGNTAWVGFTAGTVSAAAQNDILTWDFYEGYAPRLATPTFSVAAGSYASTQTVSMGGPAGAAIYYTTNGKQPTTSSSQYTGPISVSASEIVQAIAVETGYTDSAVAAANYQIAQAGTPVINFPSGFASASNLIIASGTASLTGSDIRLTDTTRNNEVGAAWYVVPVNVQSFTTNFTLNLASAQANGMTFCIQNQPPASATQGPGSRTSSWLWVSGGPTAFASQGSGLGYSGETGTTAGQIAGLLSSVAVKFDLYTGSGNTTGLYTNGADVSQNGIDMSSSGLSLHSGHPLAVTLSYDGTTLSMTIKDTVSSATYSHSWTVNIPQTVGASTAYVGFTGATGGLTAMQDVSAWTYATEGQTPGQSPAVPMAPTNFSVH